MTPQERPTFNGPGYYEFTKLKRSNHYAILSPHSTRYKVRIKRIFVKTEEEFNDLLGRKSK